jgi:hypothetical protein
MLLNSSLFSQLQRCRGMDCYAVSCFCFGLDWIGTQRASDSNKEFIFCGCIFILVCTYALRVQVYGPLSRHNGFRTVCFKRYPSQRLAFNSKSLCTSTKSSPSSVLNSQPPISAPTTRSEDLFPEEILFQAKPLEVKKNRILLSNFIASKMSFPYMSVCLCLCLCLCLYDTGRVEAEHVLE